VQVASVQALVRRPNALSQVDLVFVDEAHHVTTGNLYAKLLGWWPNAKVIGLTATPWRLDGAGLADVFDGHVLACTPRQLRDEGYLVPVGGWEYAPVNTRKRPGDRRRLTPRWTSRPPR
jgi:DNA repair protein RadD